MNKFVRIKITFGINLVEKYSELEKQMCMLIYVYEVDN